MTSDVKSEPKKKISWPPHWLCHIYSTFKHSNTDLFSWTPSWHWVWHRLEVLPLLTSSSVCNLLNSMEMVRMEKSSGPLRMFEHNGTLLQSSEIYVQYTNRMISSSWWDCICADLRSSRGSSGDIYILTLFIICVQSTWLRHCEERQRLIYHRLY